MKRRVILETGPIAQCVRNTPRLSRGGHVVLVGHGEGIELLELSIHHATDAAALRFPTLPSDQEERRFGLAIVEYERAPAARAERLDGGSDSE
jgi:hypothetical protein